MKKVAGPAAPLEGLHTLAQTCFKPDLQPPRRVNDPIPPSLAASKLPPPCAEVDERPAWRYRRFRLWRDAVVPLRVAVVDANRRIHLRRYQSYAIPASPVITRGSFAVHWIPPPTPHSTRPAFPAAEHMVPSQGFSTAQRRISMNPPASGRAPSPPKLSKAEHKARRLRLLQFRYALDQEHERRFRRAMRAVIPNIVDFETKSMVRESPNDRAQWIQEVDLDLVRTRTQFFRDIRKKSDNVFHYVDPSEHPPVPRRQEVHERVKKQEQERKARKARKKEMQAQNQVEQGIVPTEAPAGPPTLSTAPSTQTQTLEPTDQNVPATRVKTTAAGDKNPSRRRSRSPAESLGDLTDATTASEASVRTPQSPRPRVVSSKSASPIRLAEPRVSAGEEATPKTDAIGGKTKEGKERRDRFKRNLTTPPMLDGSVAQTHPFSQPGTPSATETLESIDQDQLQKDLQVLLAKLSMKVPESITSNTSVASGSSSRHAVVDQGSSLANGGSVPAATSTKKRHRGRLVIVRSKSDKRSPHAAGNGDHDHARLGAAQRVVEGGSEIPKISIDRVARLADLEERVEAPVTSTATPPADAPPPPCLSASSHSPSMTLMSPENQAPPTESVISTLVSSQKSHFPAFAELNMDEDTAAPFRPTSRASSISPSEFGWKSGSEGGTDWSDSLDGGSALEVSVQDTAGVEDGSIDTAVPVMRRKEIYGSV